MWVEILPIRKIQPKEFKENKGHDGKSITVRQWSFMELHGLENVMFEDIDYKGKSIKVVKVGTNEGNISLDKCWWLHSGGPCKEEVRDFTIFSQNLNSLRYPPLSSMQHVKTLLDGWIQIVSGKIFA